MIRKDGPGKPSLPRMEMKWQQCCRWPPSAEAQILSWTSRQRYVYQPSLLSREQICTIFAAESLIMFNKIQYRACYMMLNSK